MPKGWSVPKQASHGIPHASVAAAGRAADLPDRIVGDVAALPAVARRRSSSIGWAPAATRGRLACQVATRGPRFLPHLPPQTSAGSLRRSGLLKVGEGAMWCACSSTCAAHRHRGEKLPFDTVFSVNRFLAAVSHAVEEAGGRPNQFVGDGLFALARAGSTPSQCAAGRSRRSAGLPPTSTSSIRSSPTTCGAHPFGIGVNGGEVIVGDIGYKQHLGPPRSATR